VRHLLVVLLLVGFVGGCTKRSKGEACERTADCKEGLICLVVCVSEDVFDKDGLVQQYQDERSSKTACAEDTPPCSLHGRCTWKKGQGCIATSDEVCRRTIWCKQLGRCRAKGGRCRK
jgi:hypothetical protein